MALAPRLMKVATEVFIVPEKVEVPPTLNCFAMPTPPSNTAPAAVVLVASVALLAFSTPAMFTVEDKVATPLTFKSTEYMFDHLLAS